MIHVFPLASKMHDRSFYTELLSSYLKVLSDANVQVSNVITSVEDIENLKVKDVKVAIPIFLTGGTSGLARALASKLGKSVPLLMVAHGYHNSLASALSAKNRLLIEGYKTSIIFSEKVDDVKLGILAARAVSDVKSMRVLLVSEEDGEAADFERAIGAKAFKVSLSEVEEAIDKVETAKAREVLSKLAAKLDVSYYNTSLIEKPLKLPLALKELLRKYDCNSLAINCFPLIVKFGFSPCIAISLLNDEGIPAACEADLRSLVLLRISLTVSKKPGWIANPCSLTEDGLIFAHCAIATNLIKGGKLSSHFESNNPVAIAGEVEEGEYLLASLSYDYKELFMDRVYVERSGMISDKMCRTQVVLKPSTHLRDFVRKAISNHHVLMPLELLNVLPYIADLLTSTSLHKF